MRGTCATCQYWGDVWHPLPALPTGGFRPCRHPALHCWYGAQRHNEPPDGAFMVNGEAEGLLYTGPAFGCMRWRAQEP